MDDGVDEDARRGRQGYPLEPQKWFNRMSVAVIGLSAMAVYMQSVTIAVFAAIAIIIWAVD